MTIRRLHLASLLVPPTVVVRRPSTMKPLAFGVVSSAVKSNYTTFVMHIVESEVSADADAADAATCCCCC